MRKCFLWVLLSIFCGCGDSNRAAFRVGVDPTWAPLSFGELESYVNGYTEEVLFEIAQYNGGGFQKMNANWDTLLEGMHRGRYDAVLTSLPRYSFNQAAYDFSDNFLDLGPVLVVPAHSKVDDLSLLAKHLVGVIAEDPSILLLQKYPDAILRQFSSIPDLLNALAMGEVSAALLDRLSAVNYVQDLYQGQLKIGSSPLTDAGLHLVTLKGKHQVFLRRFNGALKKFRKKHQLETLQKKWHM
jgi:ABC-type amino acid transport substrate-binding protein